MRVLNPRPIYWTTTSVVGKCLLLLARAGLVRGLSRAANLLGRDYARRGRLFRVQCGAVSAFLDLREPVERHLFLGMAGGEVLRFYTSVLRFGDTMVDIGANVGFHSVVAGSLVGSSGLVLACEPNPDLYGRLGRIVQTNPLHNIKRIPTALSNEPGVSPFYVSRIHGRSSLEAMWSPETLIDRIYVNTVTGDDLLARWSQMLPVRLIKIDVEGHEVAVLRGMTRVLRDGVIDCVVFEVSPPGHPAFNPDILSSMRELRECGYELFAIKDNGVHSIQIETSDLLAAGPGFNLVAIRGGLEQFDGYSKSPGDRRPDGRTEGPKRGDGFGREQG